METNEKGLNLIKSFEGFHLTAYKCPAGVWTIGYGHTNGVTEGMTITEEMANELLKEDLKNAEKYVTNKKLNINENQFSALVSFTFNCGSANLTRLVKNRTIGEIGDALLLYNKANGKVLAGLTRRRTAERGLYFSEDSGEYYPAYSGTRSNIDDIFCEIGAPYGNVTLRKPVAIANGIATYCGNKAQNLTLINLAKGGKLKRA